MADISHWPWPRIIKTDFRSMIVTRQSNDELYLSELFLNGNVWGFRSLLTLGDYANIAQVDVADFGNYFVVTTYGFDREIHTYARNCTLPLNFGNVTELSTPAFGVCCNNDGQLVGANIYSPLVAETNYWRVLSNDAFIWGAIGVDEFDPTVNVVAGYKSLELGSAGQEVEEVVSVRRLGKKVMVYTTARRMYMTPSIVSNVFTYGKQELPGLGVRSGNHVAGNSVVHGFIDLNGEFWVQSVDAAPIKRGYKEYIDDMLEYGDPDEDTRVVVSFCEDRNSFYISNGVDCLVVNQFGAYQIHQQPSAVLLASDGTLYGTFKETTDTFAEVVTDVLDFSSRGLKTVESITVGAQYAVNQSCYLGVDFRSRSDIDFSTLTYRYAGPGNEGQMTVTALEFRLRAKLSSYVDASMLEFHTNVKFGDRRFRRGIGSNAQTQA